MDETPEPVELIRHVFEKINLRNVDALHEHWAEDVLVQFPIVTCRNRDEVRSYFASLFAAVPDLHIDVVNIAGGGNTVLVRWHLTGTFSGAPWMGIEPTGSHLEIDGADCFIVRDGKIAENFVVYDQLRFARQIELLPPEGSLVDRMLLKSFNVRTRLRTRLRRKGE